MYLSITYGLTLAIALALPHAGITPLIAIAFPVIAVALTVAFTVPRGQRRAVWAAVGFNPRRGRGLLIAVLGPAVIIAVSFGVAAAFGVVRFPGLAPGFGLAVLNRTVTIIIFAVVFLGEEIGWRGYLLFRVAELTTVVGQHLAGQSRSQRLQQPDRDRRRRANRDLASDDGVCDDRDRRGDHDHHGAGRGLLADPSGRRLRQSRAEVPAAEQRTTSRCTTGTSGRPTLDPLLALLPGSVPTAKASSNSFWKVDADVGRPQLQGSG